MDLLNTQRPRVGSSPRDCRAVLATASCNLVSTKPSKGGRLGWRLNGMGGPYPSIQASRHSAGGGVTVFTAPTAFTPCVRDFCSWRNNRTGSSAFSLQPIDCRGEGGEKWGSRRIPSPQGHGGGLRRTEPGLRQPHSPWAGGGRGVGLKQTPPTAYRPLLHNSKG